MKLDSLVESDEELDGGDDDDDDDDGIGLEKADGNTENNVEDKVSSAGDTDGEEKLLSMNNVIDGNLKKQMDQMNADLAKILEFFERRD